MLGATNVIGAVSPTAGTLLLTANTTFGSPATLVAVMSESTNHTLTVGDSSTNSCASLINDGGTASPGSLVKQGPGQVTLTAANTYHGPTTISEGILATFPDGATGTAPSAATANQLVLNGNGATLFGNVGFTVNAKRGITVNGPSIDIATFSTPLKSR